MKTTITKLNSALYFFICCLFVFSINSKNAAGACGRVTGTTTLSVTNNSATVSWAAISCDSFLLRWNVTGTTNYLYKYINPGTATGATITGLNSATAYTWMIHTYCSGVSGYYSAATYLTTLICAAPTGLSASSITLNSASLNWATTSCDSFIVRYNVTGTTAYVYKIVKPSSTITTSISGLTSGTNYTWSIHTYCNGGLSGPYVNSTFTTLYPACSTPAGLSSSGVTYNSATLNWNVVSGAINYNIHYRIVGTSTWTNATSATNSAAVASLASSSNYEFQAQTVCTGNTSSYSASSLFSTLTSPCSVPTGLAAASITTSSATLTWAVVSGAVSYNIQYRIIGASSWTSTTSASNSKGLTSLTAASNYEFQVQTVCSGSSSSFSASQTFTTLAPPPCSTPSGLTTSSITSTSAILSWTAVSGAASYVVQYRIVGTSSWTSTTAPGTIKAISALTAGSNYEFQVQTVCSGNSSTFSSSGTFATSSAATIPVPDHVVVCIFENHSYSQIIGSSSAPRINALATDAMSASFTQSFGIEHPSQPNYLDLFSGTNQGITNNNVPAAHFTTANLARELINAGRTYKAYSEDLPSVGYDGATSGGYTRKHNPVANWMGTGTNQVPTSCNQPFTAFPTNYASLPTVSFVMPNLVNSMHDGTITQGDNWYYANMYAYAQWAKTHNSLFILMFDEDDGAHNNQIVTIFTGPMVLQGQYSTHITLYTILRTIEDMYGTTHAGNAATETAIRGCWTNGFRMADEPITAPEWNVYPNPFSSELNISYTLSQSSSVSLEMYNLLGEKVYSQTGDDANQSEGTHQLRIDVADHKIQKGLYFIRLTIDGVANSKKVVMVE